MTLFSLDPLKKDRRAIQKVIKPDTNIRVTDGWFLTFRDRVNNTVGVHHIELNRTTVQFFIEKFPKIYQDMLDFYRFSAERFPHDNWWKLRHAIDIAYLFAIAHYIHDSDTKVTQVRRFFDTRRPPYKRLVSTMHPHFTDHISGFYALASASGIQVNLFTLYKFARELIMAKCPRSQLPTNLVQYYESDTLASPFTRHFLSDELETDMQTRFMSDVSLREIVYQAEEEVTGKRCVAIPIDLDPRIRKLIRPHINEGVKIPDVLIVTEDTIFAIDIKANLSHAKRVQVSAANLKEVLRICWDDIGYIFQDVTLEGFSPPK